jgi:hypothetical protein
MQRWSVIQHELLPELKNEVGALTPKLEKVIHTLEWVRIEEFTALWSSHPTRRGGSSCEPDPSHTVPMPPHEPVPCPCISC